MSDQLTALAKCTAWDKRARPGQLGPFSGRRVFKCRRRRKAPVGRHFF